MEIEQEVRDFLTSRRARITPQRAGLRHVGGSRRVPGLRREELAMLAGVSVEYYTRMERGRIGGASDGVLDAISRVLELSDDERAHLYDLARNANGAPLRVRAQPSTPITASVQQVIDSMSVPAVIISERLDLLAANHLGRMLYAMVLDSAEQPANFSRFVFLDPRAAGFYVDHDDAKDFVVAVLRAASGRDPLDRATSALVGELSARSADFRGRWARHEVRRHSSGRKSIMHPVVGRLDLAYDDFTLPGDPHTSITTYTADPGSPTADGLVLLASWEHSAQSARHEDVS
ncbi:helix-turn-helix transcriptional regulator [Microbacterium sp. 8M]|uniref:helix-turn-helix transcriptional regulator n=1 Tax=Microbacterium sp. 8M TaxID=2653153 RepID=UPI00135735CD|nr:helix-turn-helix transcriptional regulator [Microbacterium sp. 8M]